MIKGVSLKLLGNDDDLRTKVEENDKRIEGLRKLASGIHLELDDKKGRVQLKEFGFALDRISKANARPGITIAGIDRVDLQLDKLDLKLDALGHKKVEPEVAVNVKANWLQRLIGRGFGLPGGNGGNPVNTAEGAASAGEGMFSGSLGGIAKWAGIIGLGSVAASLAPSVIGLGTGLGVGGAGAAGAIALGSKAHQQMLTYQNAVNSAQSGVTSARLSVRQAASATSRLHAEQRLTLAMNKLHAAQTTANQYQQQHSAVLKAYKGFSGLGHTALGVFQGALTSNRTYTHMTRHGAQTVSVPGTSFAAGLSGIFSTLGGTLKSLAPELAQLFRASLPFIKAFARELGPIGRILLPALTSTMKTFVKSGAMKLMMQGITMLVSGLAGFMKALGPGMHASAVIFKGVMKLIEGALIVAGNVFSGLAGTIESVSHAIRVGFDKAVGFVTGFHKQLVSALTGLGSELWNVGWNAITGLINGLEAKAMGAINWAKHLGNSIIGAFKSAFHIGSPSRVMHSIGLNVGLGLANGIAASHGLVTSSAARLASAVPAQFSGSATGSRSNSHGLVMHVEGSHDELVNAIVKALRYEIRTNGQGNVQGHLGWGTA